MAPHEPPAAAGDDATAIKTMKLYSHVERIENELKSRGLATTDSSSTSSPAKLDPEVLSHIDSMHYEGDEGMKAAISAAELRKGKAVLDIGSGFGGPARILASRTGCTVTALELQPDIHDKAQELTARCDLSDLVTHVNGNILEHGLTTTTAAAAANKLGDGPGTFDAVTSWLVFLHIDDKAALFGKCAAMLKDGGVLFADDFFARGTFTETEEISLRDDVFAFLRTKEEYVEAITEAGFVDVTFEDKTEDWTVFVNGRLKDFVAKRTEFEEVHGAPTYEKLFHFYEAIVNLFNGGHLGGLRVCAKKMTTASSK